MKDFWDDKERLMRLAGMVAEDFDDSDDEDDEKTRELDARYDREQQVCKYVRQVFSELKIEVLDDQYAVTYDTPPENTVTVLLSNNHEFTIRELANLYKSGMGRDYIVAPYDNITLKIMFKWNAV